MGNNFYISDLHLGHANVIRFDNRPFADIYEMEEAIVSKWNDTVGKQDTVYHLGDFCWSKDVDEWCRLLDRLNGNKVIIKGNHDLSSYPAKLKSKVQDIKDYKEVIDNGKKVILCHYPIPFYKRDYSEDTIMLCGHVHITEEDRQLEAIRSTAWQLRKDGVGVNIGNILNVGCMKPYMNYRPRTITYLSEILSKLKASETHDE